MRDVSPTQTPIGTQIRVESAMSEITRKSVMLASPSAEAASSSVSVSRT